MTTGETVQVNIRSESRQKGKNFPQGRSTYTEASWLINMSPTSIAIIAVLSDGSK